MDQSETSFEIQTIVNPSPKPFDIIYNNKLFRTIPAGKAIRLPKRPFGILAEKHLIDRMCNLNNEPTNDPNIRAKWRSQVVLEEDIDSTSKLLDADDVLQRKLDVLNQTNTSDGVKVCPSCGTKTLNLEEHTILNHATPESNHVEVVSGMPNPNETIDPERIEERKKHNADILARAVGAKTEEKLTVTPDTGDDATPAPAPVVDTTQEGIKADPTREDLIVYARDVMKMNVEDPKTKQILETTPVEQLVKELNYGI